MKISILGAGAWGTALAIALAARHAVMLWGRDADAIHELAARRENRRYLPGCALPEALALESDFEAAVAHAADADGLLIAACPVAGLRELAERLRAQTGVPSHLVWLCKGFEQDSLLLPHQVVRAVLGGEVALGVLSGPSFAQEVARGLPCALTAASADAALAQRMVAAAHGGTMRVYSSDDVVGVEVGGAVKNILAIATGIGDGLGLGLNARAALITRGLAEITRLGVALGGRSETFMGLAGVGDLILTCTGDLSRNRRVGLALAAGKPLRAVIAELGHVAEGVYCARAVRERAKACGVDMPIADAVAAVLFDGAAPRQAVTQLLARDPREESA
ncbi:MAG: NAD(P)H-dependent glycerol-3-phosphate dehydrogenase [Burkholderiaceae bacterium]